MANDSEKTTRIGYLCFTIFALGFLFFLNKVNACAMACNSCNTTQHEYCHDEFIEIKNNDSSSNHACYPGAVVEVVASPPSPKPGIICHCINKDVDAEAPNAQ